MWCLWLRPWWVAILPASSMVHPDGRSYQTVTRLSPVMCKTNRVSRVAFICGEQLCCIRGYCAACGESVSRQIMLAACDQFRWWGVSVWCVQPTGKEFGCLANVWMWRRAASLWTCALRDSRLPPRSTVRSLIAVHLGYGTYIWLSVSKLPLQCAIVWLYSVVNPLTPNDI
jgi:hypothetical protein